MTRKENFQRGGTPRNEKVLTLGPSYIYLGFDPHFDVWVDPKDTFIFEGETFHHFKFLYMTHDCNRLQPVTFLNYYANLELRELVLYLETCIPKVYSKLNIKRFVV